MNAIDILGIFIYLIFMVSMVAVVGYILRTLTGSEYLTSQLPPLRKDYHPNDIGLLMERLCTDMTHDVEIYGHLARLLPRMKPEHASRLTPRHHQYLNDYLESASWDRYEWRGPNRLFLLALLDIYPRYGGRSARRDIERIAWAKDTWAQEENAEIDPVMQAAARCCLDRWQHALDNAHLVRASDAPDNVKTLLRSAASTSATASTSLLRSVPPEEIMNLRPNPTERIE